jgi:hypothetical protein
MGDLFREFMQDVLDVKSIAKPPLPNFFSVFLEEEKESPEDTVAALEHKRNQIEDGIERLQNELHVINKRLARMETHKSKTSHRKVK